MSGEYDGDVYGRGISRRGTGGLLHVRRGVRRVLGKRSACSARGRQTRQSNQASPRPISGQIV